MKRGGGRVLKGCPTFTITFFTIYEGRGGQKGNSAKFIIFSAFFGLLSLAKYMEYSIHLSFNISGIRSLKSFGSEQKQTVSVYKRIESRPIGELDKVF